MTMLALALLIQTETAISVSSVTGGVLAEICRVDRGMQLDPCASYILGVADALQIDRTTCCPPTDAATIQTLTIVRRYIHDHPENWGWSPIALVKTPLVAAFPCRSVKYKSR